MQEEGNKCRRRRGSKIIVRISAKVKRNHTINYLPKIIIIYVSLSISYTHIV